jgi:hypothetical protein
MLATALADRSMLVDRYDDLPEAERILARWLAAGDPENLVSAAISVAQAIVARARWAGDREQLEEGLELVARALSQAPPMLPSAQRMLLMAHATGLLLLRTDAGGDSRTAERLHDAATHDLERALASTRRFSTDRADLMIELASTSSAHPRDGGLDAAIDRCRAALRSLRWRPMRVREAGCLVLADLLTERSEQDSDRRSGDLAEAVRLCELVATRGPQPYLGLARLPLLLEAADADESVVAAGFRRAFAAVSTVSFVAAGDIAADWGSWAERRCYTAEAAEAHLCWIRILVTQSQRLRLRGERERPPWEVQALTADAGFWLLASGRRRDAALALDLGAGVALYERMHRDRGEVEQRLADAGREDLGERWLEVGERMLRATVASDVRPDASGASAIRVGGQAFRGRFGPRDGVPLADYDRLVREIGRVPGFEDVDAPPTYEDLREAARDGPVVYLAATSNGGYAVVVTEAAPEPAVVALPRLTSDDVQPRAAMLLTASGADAAEALESTLAWLAVSVWKPLAPVLAAPALVTLVPVGALGMLPLHAAGRAPARDGRWRDATGGLVFRYAPNAAMLARAQAIARGAGGFDAPVATAEASDSVEQVLGALGDAAIWHLACPTEHGPDDPLSSRLRLADGRLSLRAMLAPERTLPRLAMLSACRTTIEGTPDLDELVSIAGALLHCGVAGIVSSHTVIDDRGAEVLMRAFLQRLLEGVDPAHALAAAQTWLSAATNREISAAFGPAHAFPAELSEAMRPQWERRREFAHPRSWAVFSYCGA